MGSDSESFPYFWTMITCVFFEASWFFLALHLLMLNYLVNQLEHVWSRTSFATLVVFSAFSTSIFRLAYRLIYSHAFENGEETTKSVMAQSYCSINHLIIIILMGCRQSYPERQLDTGVPFITSNVVLPFKQLPVAYVFMCLLCAFIFELGMDFSLVGCLYFSWLFMRLFMVTKQTPPNQIGDSSNAFAL